MAEARCLAAKAAEAPGTSGKHAWRGQEHAVQQVSSGRLIIYPRQSGDDWRPLWRRHKKNVRLYLSLKMPNPLRITVFESGA